MSIGTAIILLYLKNIAFLHMLSMFLIYLHFSPCFLRLHNRMAMVIAIISKTMEAAMMVTIIITLDVPMVFSKPIPKNRRNDIFYF